MKVRLIKYHIFTYYYIYSNEINIYLIGSSHDGFVFNKALDLGFTIPNNKYVLADAGFRYIANRVLVPYRNVKYHLREWNNGSLIPHNNKELFNFRHSSLRQVIERCIGCLKKRFAILRNNIEYGVDVIPKIIYCCICLHNFIRLNGFEYITDDEINDFLVELNENNEEVNNDNNDNNDNENWRNIMANYLWINNNL